MLRSNQCDFPTYTDFKQRKLWVLKGLSFPLNSPEMGILVPNFVFCEGNFPTGYNLREEEGGQLPAATTPLSPRPSVYLRRRSDGSLCVCVI